MRCLVTGGQPRPLISWWRVDTNGGRERLTADPATLEKVVTAATDLGVPPSAIAEEKRPFENRVGNTQSQTLIN